MGERKDPICRGAPHLVIAHGRKDNPAGFTDAVIALTHLDLAAPVLVWDLLGRIHADCARCIPKPDERTGAS